MLKHGPEQSSTAVAVPEPVTLAVEGSRSVSGLIQLPAGARACYVLAHGAGAGMKHPFLTSLAAGLAPRSIGSLRYQFLYMEEGSKRPDPPWLAQAAVRAAVAQAAVAIPQMPLFAGGKSFGGRMTSRAQAESPLPGVRGLIFVGFPLHPPGKPSDERARHLFEVDIPMLLLQGTRDEFAQLSLLEPLVDKLGGRAHLKLFPDADHSFHVPARTGRTDAQVMTELMDTIAQWIERVLHA